MHLTAVNAAGESPTEIATKKLLQSCGVPVKTFERLRAELRCLDAQSFIYPWPGLEEAVAKAPDRTLLLVGYGSLMNRDSAAGVIKDPSRADSPPVLVLGARRVFTSTSGLCPFVSNWSPRRLGKFSAALLTHNLSRRSQDDTRRMGTPAGGSNNELLNMTNATRRGRIPSSFSRVSLGDSCARCRRRILGAREEARCANGPDLVGLHQPDVDR
jgi:hypothetical protein